MIRSAKQRVIHTPMYEESPLLQVFFNNSNLKKNILRQQRMMALVQQQKTLWRPLVNQIPRKPIIKKT